jgi:hypothetical protein
MAGLDEAAAREAIVAAARSGRLPPSPPGDHRSLLQQNRWAVLVLALPLATGAALVVHMLTDRSLAAALGVAAALALLGIVLAARHLPPSARADARRRARTGVLAGLAGLAAYDLSRVLLVIATGFETKPFKALPHFGRGLLGPDVSDTAAWIGGSGYHVANGIGFAVAYCLAVRRPDWRTGIAWALLLEATMIVFYPSWLQIKALEEFVTVSLLGHFAYGGTLGAVAAHLAGRHPRQNEPDERAPRPTTL